MNGAERIMAERQRQVGVEGWTPEHDDHHRPAEALAWAAVAYATPDYGRITRRGVPEDWPWDAKDWKPGDRIRELEKAGALIAAEIDRLLREPGMTRSQGQEDAKP